MTNLPLPNDVGEKITMRAMKEKVKEMEKELKWIKHTLTQHIKPPAHTLAFLEARKDTLDYEVVELKETLNWLYNNMEIDEFQILQAQTYVDDKIRQEVIRKRERTVSVDMNNDNHKDYGPFSMVKRNNKVDKFWSVPEADELM